MKIDTTKVCDVKVEGIDHKNAPDYCDAFISEAWIEIDSILFCLIPNAVENKGRFFRPLSENELDWLNDQRDFVYSQVEKAIH